MNDNTIPSGDAGKTEKTDAASGPSRAGISGENGNLDRSVGYGAYRGLICGLFTALGVAVAHGLFLIVYFLTAYNRASSDYEKSMMDNVILGFEVVEEYGVYLISQWMLLIVPPGVIVGVILGAAGIIRKKKRQPEPPPSEPGP